MAKKYIETIDALGRKHVFDLGSPKKEEKLARDVHDNANKLLAKFGGNPEVLERLLGINDNNSVQTSKPIPTVPQTKCNEAIEQYIKKLQTRGRKGKRLTERTLQNYIGRLNFWSDVFGALCP